MNKLWITPAFADFIIIISILFNLVFSINSATYLIAPLLIAALNAGILFYKYGLKKRISPWFGWIALAGNGLCLITLCFVSIMGEALINEGLSSNTQAIAGMWAIIGTIAVTIALNSALILDESA